MHGFRKFTCQYLNLHLNLGKIQVDTIFFHLGIHYYPFFNVLMPGPCSGKNFDINFGNIIWYQILATTWIGHLCLKLCLHGCLYFAWMQIEKSTKVFQLVFLYHCFSFLSNKLVFYLVPFLIARLKKVIRFCS